PAPAPAPIATIFVPLDEPSVIVPVCAVPPIRVVPVVKLVPIVIVVVAAPSTRKFPVPAFKVSEDAPVAFPIAITVAAAAFAMDTVCVVPVDAPVKTLNAYVPAVPTPVIMLTV